MNKHFRQLFPLLLLIFIDSFSYFVVIPVILQLFYNPHYGLLPLGTSLAARNILTGFTIALSTFAALVAAPLIGSASDKVGRKKTLLVCLIGITVGFLLPIIGILKKSLILILLGRFVAGVGSASQPVAQAAVADVCEGREKSFFLSLIALMMTLPIILGPLAGGYLSDRHLVSWFSVTVPYWCAFILSIFSLFLILFFFKETTKSNMRAQMLSLREVILGLPKAVKNYHIGGLLLIFFLMELGWSQYYQTIFLYLHQAFHYSARDISIFNAYVGVWMTIALLFLYPLLIRFFRVEKIMRASIVFILIGFAGCLLFPVPLGQWIFSPFIAVFAGCAYVSLVTLMSNRVPANHQGWAMGYISTVLFFAWMVTGLAAGWLV